MIGTRIRSLDMIMYYMLSGEEGGGGGGGWWWRGGKGPGKVVKIGKMGDPKT